MSPRRANEVIRFGDRLVTALVAGVCGFGTMLVVWLLVMFVGGRCGEDLGFPFYWTGLGPVPSR
jgi:hypothetical protein